MKKIIPLLLVLLLSSCARIINKPYVRVEITTNEPAKIVVDTDTFETHHDIALIKLKRQKKAPPITIYTDSLSKTISLKSKYSSTVLLNFLPPLYGLGVLGDVNKPKTYTYSKSIYVDMTDAESEYLIYNFPKKGDVRLIFSIPFVNSYLLQPEIDPGFKSSSGYWGISIGADFHYSDHRFFNLSITSTNDTDSPFANDYSGRDHFYMKSEYASITNNRIIDRFSYGYGISFGRNYYHLPSWAIVSGPFPFPFRSESTEKSDFFGFVFPAYIHLMNNFHLGLIYRPTFIQSNTNLSVKYEHLLSVDLAWKFRSKGKNNRSRPLRKAD